MLVEAAGVLGVGAELWAGGLGAKALLERPRPLVLERLWGLEELALEEWRGFA